MTSSTPRVIVVGGGIAGLAAAYRLQRQAVEAGIDVAISLIEAAPRLGGKILTEHTDGLVVEGGPDSFLSAKPTALQLCEELGLGERLVGTSEAGGGTYILRDGRLEPLPEGVTMLVPTRFGPFLRSRLLSLPGKARMGLEVLIPARRDEGDESVAAFVRRRLGNEAFERMVQPLLSGIYAGDAEQLSLQATFPRLRETERRYGSLVRGMLAQRRVAPPRPASGPRRSPFVSLRGGLGELVDALAGALERVDVRMGAAAERVDRAGAGGYVVHLSGGEALPAAAVLLATPAYVTADLVAAFDPELAQVLREIPYVSTATISLAYRRADVADAEAGRGFVIPRVEGRELTAVTWASNKFPGRAPDDLMLVRGFVGRAGRESAVDLPDGPLLQLVRDELTAILGLRAEPVFAQIYRWHRALPQYVLGHLERVAAIEQRLAQLPGLLVLGAAYRGVGIPDCIQSGNVAASQAMAILAGRPAAGVARD